VVSPACGSEVALFGDVGQLKIRRIHTEIFCDMRHHHFNREEYLRTAKAAEGAVGDCVGFARVTVYFQVRNMVDAASADAGALKDDHGH
jgi:hypothetical protein